MTDGTEHFRIFETKAGNVRVEYTYQQTEGEGELPPTKERKVRVYVFKFETDIDGQTERVEKDAYLDDLTHYDNFTHDWALDFLKAVKEGTEDSWTPPGAGAGEGAAS